jgi:hypothetical protein
MEIGRSMEKLRRNCQKKNSVWKVCSQRVIRSQRKLLMRLLRDIHDRVIISTAIYTDTELVCLDIEISKVYDRVIW